MTGIGLLPGLAGRVGAPNDLSRATSSVQIFTANGTFIIPPGVPTVTVLENLVERQLWGRLIAASSLSGLASAWGVANFRRGFAVSKAQ